MYGTSRFDRLWRGDVVKRVKRITFIAWTRFEQRSEALAQHLGSTMHFIYHEKHGKRLQLPLRYLVQGLHTWDVLRRERPDIVFVQNPPILCVLVAFIYAEIHRAKYVIDSHTGAFFPPWGWFLWLHRMLSRRAITTIVHNKSQEKIVKTWGCHTFVLSDYPGPKPVGECFPLDGKFNVAVASSFGKDEPLDIVFAAASRLAEVCFYITGDSNRIAPSLLSKKPNNCYLTGYLPYEQYLGLLKKAHAIITLTTRNHTLLSGAYEAVSLGTPLITSDWPILRDQFPKGVVHVPNTVEGIYHGLLKAQAKNDTLRLGMEKLRGRLQHEWKHKFEQLRHYINLSPVGGEGGSFSLS